MPRTRHSETDAPAPAPARPDRPHTNATARPATIDEIDFDMAAPHINRFNWLQREYTRMVHKNAQLMMLTHGAKAPRGGATSV